jgi:uncharacterized membrane protein
MIKTMTFGVMHFVIAFSVAYLLTGDVVIGGAVALIEPAVNTVAYYFHDRVWERWRARRQAVGSAVAA